MFSVRLRHRTDPQTDAPRAIAYSAMWLPTKPVIPVMSKRTALYPTRSEGAPAPAAGSWRSVRGAIPKRMPPTRAAGW